MLVNMLKDAVSVLIYILRLPFHRPQPTVLLYHSIDRIPRAGDPLKLNVDPELFERQMAHVAHQGVRCAISFDDGYGGVYRHAFPILQRHRLPCMLFLATDYIDRVISLPASHADASFSEPLTWEQIRRMGAWGMEIGSHSLSHRNMACLDEATARRESLSSRERIRRMTGQEVRAFSYPFGHWRSFSRNTHAILQEAGYTRAYINILGAENAREEPFQIRRIRIYGTDTMFRFRMKLAGAYDWVDLLARVLF